MQIVKGMTYGTGAPRDRTGQPETSRTAREGPAPTPGAALIETSPARERPRVTSALVRPNANFLTQLIATIEKSPQTRALRRADTADVDAAYRAAASQGNGAQPAGGITQIEI